MSETHWFRRGDGAEFAVQPGSDAEENLIRSGAMRIVGPGAVATEDAKSFDPQDADELATGTKAEILAWAEAQGYEISLTKADPKDAILTAVNAAIEARKAAEAGG